MKFQAEIESAFTSTETKDDIALRLGCSAIHINKVWQKAKKECRLPDFRPHFSNAIGFLKETDTDVDFEAMSDAEFAEALRQDDLREAIRETANRCSSDALLAALTAAHGRPRKLSGGKFLPPLSIAPDMIEVRA